MNMVVNQMTETPLLVMVNDRLNEITIRIIETSHELRAHADRLFGSEAEAPGKDAPSPETYSTEQEVQLLLHNLEIAAGELRHQTSRNTRVA